MNKDDMLSAVQTIYVASILFMRKLGMSEDQIANLQKEAVIRADASPIVQSILNGLNLELEELDK